MENVSYALKIAGATLIAAIIIALIVYVFGHLKTYQQSQEDAITRENMSQFNKTFEVYQKSLMYGTDVLSCLNQAESNNQKYVYNIYYGQDNSSITYEQRTDLMVQVNVTLKTPVQEKISVNFRREETGAISQTTNEYNFKPFKNAKGFNLPTITFYYFSGSSSASGRVNQNTDTYNDILWTGASGSLSENFKLKAGTYNTTMVAGNYSLIAENADDSDETGKLIALLSTVTEPEQTIYNDNYVGTGDNGSNAWYSATWTTAAYNFKTKKFKCTDISYSSTGYVNSLSFEEVN